MTRTDSVAQDFENWTVLQKFLPLGWQEEARKCGALKRARGVASADDLLRILLIHLANGCSLVETAVRARESGLGQISSVALFKRLRAAESWLRWLALKTRGEGRVPMVEGARCLRAVDATNVSESGSTGTDWRIHYSVNLGNLECDFFELTDIHHGGETFRRVNIHPRDIMLGDRVYASPPGVAHIVDSHADVVVRLNRQSLPLYKANGERLDVLQTVRGARVSAPREWEAAVHHPGGRSINGRLIVIARSAQAVLAERRRLRRSAQRRQEKLSQASLKAARYFMVWTSLPPSVPATTVLEYYRLRWQIELVFKRMKSIMGLGHLPKTDPVSSRAWLEGKLFVGLLVEKMIDAARSFSPWGYRLEQAPEPVEGN